MLQQRAHYHADVINLYPELGINKGAWGQWYSRLGLHQRVSRPIFFIQRWTTHSCNLYQVCVVVAVEGHPRIAHGVFTLKALLIYPPHAVVMRLHGCDVGYVVILILKAVDLLGL